MPKIKNIILQEDKEEFPIHKKALQKNALKPKIS